MIESMGDLFTSKIITWLRDSASKDTSNGQAKPPYLRNMSQQVCTKVQHMPCTLIERLSQSSGAPETSFSSNSVSSERTCSW